MMASKNKRAFKNDQHENQQIQMTQMNLKDGYDSSEESDYSEDDEESSGIDSTNRELANGAIRDVKNAQEESYPGSAENPIMRQRYSSKNNLSGQKSSQDHIKLTKLK